MSERTDTDLVRWIVENPPMWSLCQARWSAVGAVFGLGSTSASKLCLRFGFDPDETRRAFRASGGRRDETKETSDAT